MIPHSLRFISAAVLFPAAMVVLPLLIDLGSNTMNILILFFIYVILSQSWNLSGGYTGLINLGLAAFFGCGVLVTHLLWKIDVPIFFAVAAGGLSSVVLAGIIGLPTLRLKGVYFAIGTIALAEALRIIVGNVFPGEMSMPGTIATNFEILPRYYAALGVAILTLLVVYFMAKSRLGLAMVCVREDEVAARIIGINAFKYEVIAFLISALLAGLAGGVYAYNRFYFHHISVVFEPFWTFEPLMAVVVGGAGTLLGPVLGSFFLVVLSEVFALTMGEAHLMIFGLLFVLVVLYSPAGLMGWAVRLRKVIARLRPGLDREKKGI